MSAEKLKLKLDRSQDGSLIYRVSIWRRYDHPRDFRVRWLKQEIGFVEKISHKKWQATTDWGRVIGQYQAHRHATLRLWEEFEWNQDLGRYVSKDEAAFNQQITDHRKGTALDQVKPGVRRLLQDSSFSFTDYTRPRLGVEDDEVMSLADLIANNLDD
jgi:hypothetical protein